MSVCSRPGTYHTRAKFSTLHACGCSLVLYTRPHRLQTEICSCRKQKASSSQFVHASNCRKFSIGPSGFWLAKLCRKVESSFQDRAQVSLFFWASLYIFILNVQRCHCLSHRPCYFLLRHQAPRSRWVGHLSHSWPFQIFKSNPAAESLSMSHSQSHHHHPHHEAPKVLRPVVLSGMTYCSVN